MSVILPPHCDLCGVPMDNDKSPVCQPCFAKFRLVGNNYCTRCGAPLGDFVGVVKRCVHCEKHKSGYGVESVVAAGAYDGAVRDLVMALKYGRRIALANIAAAWIAQLVIDRGVACDIVTCVPLGRIRERERGFNQAGEIARRAAKLMGIPFDARLLRRRRETTPQAQLPEESRAKNVARAFETTRHAFKAAAGKRVLLVDDVLTTGATLAEAARALVKAKPSAIHAAIVARAV